MDPKIPLTGSAVKRKRLSDITNTVSSSRVAISDAQFPEKTKEVACGITKECIGQLMEENVTLLKALGERNKIIELSSIEMQKLRFTAEKANQQNRMLAQANSQMLAELTSSKERLKTLQHELGCTVAVLRLKNLALDEKEKLNKELSEKIVIQEGHSKLFEVATNVRRAQSVCNSVACRLDGISQSDEEKLDNELREKTKTEEERLNRELCENDSVEEEHSECAKVATDASLSHAVDNNMSCEPNRKQTHRSQSSGAAAAMTHQVEAKEKDARRKSSRRISNNLTSEARERKDNLPETENLEVPACPVINELLNEHNTVQAKPSATVSRPVEAVGKNETRTRKSSRRRSNNLTSEACESKDNLPEVENVEVPACPVIIEPPNEDSPAQAKSSTTVRNQIEAADRARRSSRRRSNNVTSEARESKDNLPEVENVKVPACPVIIEPLNEDNPAQVKSSATVRNQIEADVARTGKSSRRRFNNLTSVARESKDNFPVVENVEVPACPVISEPPNEDNPVQAKSSATVRNQIEAAERDDARARKSSGRRSSNEKSEPRESKGRYLETADVKNPACPPITEPVNEDNPVQERTSAPLNSDASLKHEESMAQKDPSTYSQSQGHELSRTSVGRPMRRAAEKVCSYREVPLNVKMRRAG